MDNNQGTPSIIAIRLRRTGSAILALAALVILGLTGWLCLKHMSVYFEMAIGVAFILIVIPLAAMGLVICVVGHFSLISDRNKSYRKILFFLAVIETLAVLIIILYYSLGHGDTVLLLIGGVLLLPAVVLSVMLMWKSAQMTCLILLELAVIFATLEMMLILPQYGTLAAFPLAAILLFLLFALNAVMLWNSKNQEGVPSATSIS